MPPDDAGVKVVLARSGFEINVPAATTIAQALKDAYKGFAEHV